jgi:hypothetical protein
MPHTVDLSANIVFALLNILALDLYFSHFKMTMIHNSEVVMCDQNNNLNPLTRLWWKVTTSPINQKLSKYMKLIEVNVVHVLGSIENECTFNTLSFMKNQLQNWLSMHLDLCTQFYSQQIFSLQIFPYEKAIAKWQSTTRYNVNA